MRLVKWLFLLIPFAINGQPVQHKYADTLFSTYYHQRVSHFKTLKHSIKDIVFLGNSITDGAEWGELFEDEKVKNRGISGDFSAGILNRLDEVLQVPPAKIFLLIGINDLARNISTDSLWRNYQYIINAIKSRSTATKIYIQSILPVNGFYKKFTGQTSKTDSIIKMNEIIQNNQADFGYTYINLYSSFCDADGKLKLALTNDGLHLKGEGYVLWKHLVYPYVYDVAEKPSLLPEVKKIEWTNTIFPLWKVEQVILNDSSLLDFDIASLLQKEVKVNVAKSDLNLFFPSIKISLAKIETPLLNEEGYSIHIDSSITEIKANTLKGIYYALQTLQQLSRDRVIIDGCDITDWPSFSWRAYMTDVGRNYESINLLKQQIEIMSKYKLNVFHFHLTEDIAWRWQIIKYPQLTAAENMLRGKGMYYSVAEIKELIKYCKDRFILLVPELDMPGHSAAFERAMGVSMQSEKGKEIISEILKEIFETYSFTYFHIGGDEVKIVDTGFIPFVEKIVRSNNTKVIGWKPGGNFGNKTILQLWNGNEKTKKGFSYIDSRHLYINHLDPFESVTTIYNRKIGNVTKQTDEVLGAEICLWHDRNVAKEEDILKMNPVYPSMLTFAEKTWNGGGIEDGYITNVNFNNVKERSDFSSFEKTLIEHKKLYFKALPFAYSSQSSFEWKLAGPFKNGGNLAMQFAPEKDSFETTFKNTGKTVLGKTVILRHFWDPMIKGILLKPEENTTYYALTKVWSDIEKITACWIGFNNLSRSTSSNSPAANTWDDRMSAISINGNKIIPPSWVHTSQKGNLEIPLADEGYEYRLPTQILFHRGWNNVLIKLPVGGFKGPNWNYPVKWMFTFTPIDTE